jgi:hypothetical protein
MNTLRLTTAVFIASLISACGKEPLPPVSVAEFKADPILLEATMVRCAQRRSETKYDAECVNAREAGNLLAANDREARRKELEAQSARKRSALRRTQEAAAQARRRSAEARRQREADEYLGIFEPVPGDGSGTTDLGSGVVNTQPTQNADVLPGNQPGAVVVPQVNSVPAESPTDIDSVREELKRRQESSD